MITSITAVQGLKSSLAVALTGVGLEAAASRLGPFLWFLVREALTLFFWGVLAGSSAQLAIPPFPSLGCPVQLLAVLEPLLRALSGAV